MRTNLSMQRDSIATSFREDNDGRVFQIELDALNALTPDDFTTLLEDSVDRHFDESIYEEVMEDPKYSTETIWREVPNAVKKFDKLVEINSGKKRVVELKP
jgi:hypothetical protein